MSSTQIAPGSQLVRIGPIDRPGGFSVCGWAKWSSPPDYSSVVTLFGLGGTNFLDTLETSGTGNPLGVYRGGAQGFAFADSGYVPSTSFWFWYCVVWVGTTVTLRLSTDSLTITHEVTGDIDPTIPVDRILFANNTFEESFTGQMQYLRAWGAALSGAEALAELTSLSPVRTDDLWGSWTLSDHSGGDATRLADTSGNGRNLSLLSGALSTGAEDAPVEVAEDLPAPIVRYWCNDAASGTSPTDLGDTGVPPAAPLALNYVSGSPSFFKESTGRGLQWPATSLDRAGAWFQITPGDKIDAAISGNGEATIECVVTFPATIAEDIQCIFGINRFDAEGDIVALWLMNGSLIVDANGGAGIYPANYGALAYYAPPGDPVPVGRHVVHAVFDYSQPVETDRFQLWMDGVRITTTGPTGESTPGNPALNDAFNIPLGFSDYYLSLGTYQDAAFYNGSLINARVSYAALYSVAATPGQITSRVAALTASDDPPPNPGVVCPLLFAAD